MPTPRPRHHFLPLLLSSFVAVAPLGCDPVDEPGEGETGTQAPEPPAQDEWLIATVDGEPFLSVDDTQFNRVWENGVPGFIMTSVVGVREGGDSVSMLIRNLEGTGEIDLSDTEAVRLSWVISGVDTLQNPAGEGLLEITLNTDERVEGTFWFDGHSAATGDVVEVRDGMFSILRD
ncbi:MAG: hypothetical protein AAF799_29570 [Myxococcota bacterium]